MMNSFLFGILLSSFSAIGSNIGIPLDHAFLRLPTESYNALASDKSFINSNLFFADLNRQGSDHKNHFLNGLSSYLEIFDAAQADKMKYGGNEDIGLGFLCEDPILLDTLEKHLLKKKTACKTVRLKFAHVDYLTCRGQRLGLMIHSLSGDDKKVKYSREKASAFFRKFYGYPKNPIADEMVKIELSLNTDQRSNLEIILGVLGWTRDNSQWCLKRQCIQIKGGTQARLLNATFSTTENVHSQFISKNISVIPKANKSVLITPNLLP